MAAFAVPMLCKMLPMEWKAMWNGDPYAEEWPGSFCWSVNDYNSSMHKENMNDFKGGSFNSWTSIAAMPFHWVQFLRGSTSFYGATTGKERRVFAKIEDLSKLKAFVHLSICAQNRTSGSKFFLPQSPSLGLRLEPRQVFQLLLPPPLLFETYFSDAKLLIYSSKLYS